MPKIPSISSQIGDVTASTLRLRALVNGTLPALNDQMYLRPVAHGCTVLSVNPEYRPQQGINRRWSPTTDLKDWSDALSKTLDGRVNLEAQGVKKTRKTPEKELQSFLIRDAIRNRGQMTALAAAFPERPLLNFLADEMALREPDGKKTVCDLLAVRFDGDVGVPIAIELKNTRQLKRLTEQVHKMAEFMRAYQVEFQALAEACVGRPVRLATTAERWIVWPCAGPERHGDQDPRAAKCRSENVRLITYDVDPTKGFVLHASSPSGSCPPT